MDSLHFFFFLFFNVVEAELIYCLFERAAHTNHLTFESHTEAPHTMRIVDECLTSHILHVFPELVFFHVHRLRRSLI